MGLIANVRNSINSRITAYGIAGSIPSVPEASLETLSPDGIFQDRQAQERLCDVVQSEGDEAIRHLLINYTHRTKLTILEYARHHGMDAAKVRYRTPETAPETGRVVLSIVRIMLTWIIVTAIMALKWKVTPVNAVLTGVSAAGAMAMVECWYYVGTDLMTKAWSWWMQSTKPAIWRDVDKLGAQYLHGHLSATELNQSIATARSIEARCAWDLTTRVPIGTATGLLRAEGVCAGMQTGTPLDLSLTDLCTSVLVVGGTGSGKTQLINAMIVQAAHSGDDASIVAIDPKGSSKLDIYNIYNSLPAEIQASYKFRVIGPEAWECRYNPIDPAVMTPEAAAAILTDAIKAEGGSNGDDYWNTMVAEIAYATMHIHDLAGLPRDFAALYATMTAPGEELLGIISAAEKRHEGNDHALETIKRAAEIIRVNLIEIPDKTKGNIISSISSWLGRFTMPQMWNFRTSSISLSDLLDEKCLYIIDIPESLGKPGKLLRYYLFRQIYDVALSRIPDKTKNQDRHIILFADEVQESTNQWSFRKSALSREGKLCIVAATQSRSQLLSVWGHKEATDTVTANFRSRVILGTDDLETREWAKKLISEGEMPEHSYGTSTSRNMGASMGGGAAAGNMMSGNVMGLMTGGLGSMNMGRSWGKNYTVNLKRSPLRDELFDSLGARQAICILNQGNCRRKSLAELEGLFLKKDAELARKLRDYHTSLIQEENHGTDTGNTTLEQAAPGGGAGGTNENNSCAGEAGPEHRSDCGPAGEAAGDVARPGVEAGPGEGGEDHRDVESGAAGFSEGEDFSSFDLGDDPTTGKGAAGTTTEGGE